MVLFILQIQRFFFGCLGLAALVVSETVNRLDGSCSGIDDDADVCDCLKFKLLKLVGRVLNGDDVGLREVDTSITDAIYYFLFSRLRGMLVTRYALSLIGDAGEPVRESVSDYISWVSGDRRRRLNELHNWLD